MYLVIILAIGSATLPSVVEARERGEPQLWRSCITDAGRGIAFAAAKANWALARASDLS